MSLGFNQPLNHLSYCTIQNNLLKTPPKSCSGCSFQLFGGYDGNRTRFFVLPTYHRDRVVQQPLCAISKQKTPDFRSRASKLVIFQTLILGNTRPSVAKIGLGCFNRKIKYKINASHFFFFVGYFPLFINIMQIYKSFSNKQVFSNFFLKYFFYLVKMVFQNALNFNPVIIS